MVCPYCSTDMTPIELNGKVFCSNCGLTIANNAPETPSVQPNISPAPETISAVETNSPEEVEFPVIPEIVEAVKAPVEAAPTMAAIDYFGQFSEPSPDANSEQIGRKLEVVSEDPEPIVEMSRPITEQIERDLGISTPSISEPAESKISDLVIPSEDDFAISEAISEPYVPVSSYVELANPGDEKETLEASGILLDILGEETSAPVHQPEHSKPQNDEPLNPVLEPEIPEHTETIETDDIYTLPSEIKVGIRKKKTAKAEKPAEPIASEIPEEVEVIDAKTEKKIEALEEKISELPEPVISVTPDEFTKIDPDTISKDEIHVDDNEKSKIIKDYFTTAIEKDKAKMKTKKKKVKNKKSLKVTMFAMLGLVVIAGLGGLSYFGYKYFIAAVPTGAVQSEYTFNKFTPTYVPEGYKLVNTMTSQDGTSHSTIYQFADNEEKTITLKQIRTDNAKQTISDYLLAADTTYTEKELNGVTYTETAQPSLLWENGDFVLILTTKDFTYSNDFIYKMAEAVN